MSKSDTTQEDFHIFSFILTKIKESFFFLLIIFSILFFLFYFTVKYRSDHSFYTNNKELLDNFFTIANATFISGFVGAINQFLVYNKIYQKALENVLTSTEYSNFIEENMVKFAYSKEILQNHSNLEEIWKTTTSTLFQMEFPNEISKKFYDKIHETIFYKRTISHYHFDCKYFFTFSINDNDILSIEQYSEYTVKRNKKISFKYDFNYSLLEESNNSIEFKEVTICDKNYNSEKYVKEVIKDGYITKGFESDLEGYESYNVTSRVLMNQNINTDNQYMHIFERFTEDVYVEINNKDKDKIDIIFSSSGTSEFKNIPNFDTQKHTFRGILLPGFGFKTFIIKKYEKNH
jgi:hypothetical protein